jgi:hypothetical protein
MRSGDELRELCRWVFGQYHPPGDSEHHLDPDAASAQAQQLIAKIDSDGT